MQTLSRSDLKRMNETEHDDFILINVLPRDAFLKRHIRTSVNVPVADGDFTEVVERIAAEKDRKVVVYCASFDCDASEKASRKLEDAGFTRVYDYEGGTKNWFEQARAA